jgi:hypothetical protein
LLLRSLKLLKGLQVLDAADLEDAGEGLVRSLVENRITGDWLSRDPEAHFKLLEEDFARRWNRMEKDSPSLGVPLIELTAEEKSDLQRIENNRGKERLPSIEQRAETTDLQSRYLAFRGLSSKHHSGLVAGSHGYLTEENRVALRGTYLSMAGGMVLELALVAHRYFKWDKELQIEEVFSRLKEATLGP